MSQYIVWGHKKSDTRIRLVQPKALGVVAVHNCARLPSITGPWNWLSLHGRLQAKRPVLGQHTQFTLAEMLDCNADRPEDSVDNGWSQSQTYDHEREGRLAAKGLGPEFEILIGADHRHHAAINSLLHLRLQNSPAASLIKF
ncbi:hypothetical protein FB451DRAFT_1173222 [Mycena latifolia]|nr:hypothetical protein FB451DRAFT_1173222 [Mycena latifolia]